MSISKFQTIVGIPDYKWKTGYPVKNIFMGSCFTENVGNRMAGLKYDVDVNPFGILYNPVSVASGLKILIQKKEFKHEDLIYAGGLWHSFFHHGNFSDFEPGVILEKVNNRIKTSSEYLKQAGFLFITFGTSWVYRYKRTGQFVSNCHKIPASEFERIRLTVAETVKIFGELVNEIRKINSSVKIVFTVSPIRHWKDGAIENQRSKSVLLLAIDELINELGVDNCAYFPAYEIVMDELRDYRYFAEDMIHLTDFAVSHIWEKFSESLIDERSKTISAKVNKLIQASNHKPLHRKSPEYQKFVVQMISQVNQLASEYPEINMKRELSYFNDELKEIELKSD